MAEWTKEQCQMMHEFFLTSEQWKLLSSALKQERDDVLTLCIEAKDWQDALVHKGAYRHIQTFLGLPEKIAYFIKEFEHSQGKPLTKV